MGTKTIKRSISSILLFFSLSLSLFLSLSLSFFLHIFFFFFDLLKYVKKAHEEGMVSRAAYKLQEMHKKYHIFKPGYSVLDLGAAPGGWSQVLYPLSFLHA